MKDGWVSRALSLREKFFLFAVIPESNAEHACWEWKGSTLGNGRYAVIAHKRRNIKASRVSWSIYNGREFPPELFACHSCDRPMCVNPRHIWPGTHTDNMRDASKKGRLGRQKTHCKRGHALEDWNTYPVKKADGTPCGRGCLTCKQTDNRNKAVEARKAKAALVVVEEAL